MAVGGTGGEQMVANIRDGHEIPNQASRSQGTVDHLVVIAPVGQEGNIEVAVNQVVAAKG